MHIQIYAYMHYTCIYAYTCCKCTYAYTYAYIHIHAHTQAHTHTYDIGTYTCEQQKGWGKCDVSANPWMVWTAIITSNTTSTVIPSLSTPPFPWPSPSLATTSFNTRRATAAKPASIARPGAANSYAATGNMYIHQPMDVHIAYHIYVRRYMHIHIHTANACAYSHTYTHLYSHTPTSIPTHTDIYI